MRRVRIVDFAHLTPEKKMKGLMATRREFLRTSAGVAALLSHDRDECFAGEADENAAETREQKSSKPDSTRSPLRLHALGCGYPPPYGTGGQTRHGTAFAKSPSYLDGIIMGTDELREIAKTAGVRRVILTHNGSAGSPEKRMPFIQAVGEAFSGEVLFPDEMTTIDLGTRSSFAGRQQIRQRRKVGVLCWSSRFSVREKHAEA